MDASKSSKAVPNSMTVMKGNSKTRFITCCEQDWPDLHTHHSDRIVYGPAGHGQHTGNPRFQQGAPKKAAEAAFPAQLSQ
jgi:hypothetical protein